MNLDNLHSSGIMELFNENGASVHDRSFTEEHRKLTFSLQKDSKCMYFAFN